MSIGCEEFVESAKNFIEISNSLNDGWSLCEDGNGNNHHNIYLRKQAFLNSPSDTGGKLLKAEFVVSYSFSYCVPIFAFNLWDSHGALLTLEDIRQLSLSRITKEDFYSVITQQEHPLFFQPYFMVHPCHTDHMLSAMKKGSHNLLVTFISFVAPLVRLNMPVEYAK